VSVELARAVAEIVRRTPDRPMFRAVCSGTRQVTVHGAVLAVSAWAGSAPITGQAVLVLNTGAGLVGIGLV
jgi:hypothetical protein